MTSKQDMRETLKELANALFTAGDNAAHFKFDIEADIEDNGRVFFEEVAYGINGFDILPLLFHRWNADHTINIGDSHLRNLHQGEVKYYPIGEYDGEGAINFNPSVITQDSPIIEVIFPNMDSSAESMIIMRLAFMEEE